MSLGPRLMFVATALALSACGGREGGSDRGEAPGQSCRLPADIRPYADRRFFCIGGELLAVPMKVSLDGEHGQVEYRDPRHPTTPIFADDHVMLSFRYGNEATPAEGPAFYMISIRGLHPESWARAGERNHDWRVSPSIEYIRCDPAGTGLYGCSHDFMTDRFDIRYWWNKNYVAQEDWEELDASVRTYLAGLIVEQPDPPPVPSANVGAG
ncbi:hypothetical protein GCM10009101_12520 [Brevundimonas lenta]